MPHQEATARRVVMEAMVEPAARVVREESSPSRYRTTLGQPLPPFQEVQAAWVGMAVKEGLAVQVAYLGTGVPEPAHAIISGPTAEAQSEVRRAQRAAQVLLARTERRVQAGPKMSSVDRRLHHRLAPAALSASRPVPDAKKARSSSTLKARAFI